MTSDIHTKTITPIRVQLILLLASSQSEIIDIKKAETLGFKLFQLTELSFLPGNKDTYWSMKFTIRKFRQELSLFSIRLLFPSFIYNQYR